MISFFSVMIYVTSIIAIVVTLVFYAGILMSNKNISSGQVYTSCSAQLKTCKVSSVVFVLVYWFCVSGLSKKECLNRMFVRCGKCHKLTCYSGNGQFTCDHCGNVGEVTGTIDALEGDRKHSQ